MQRSRRPSSAVAVLKAADGKHRDSPTESFQKKLPHYAYIRNGDFEKEKTEHHIKDHDGSTGTGRPLRLDGIEVRAL